MAGANAGMLAIVAALLVATVGWGALFLVRAGWDYMSARGNPRNRAQAHETLWDVGKGAALAGGAIAIAGFLIRTLSFST